MTSLVYFAFWAVVIFLMLRFGCGAHVLGHGKAKPGVRDEKGRGNAEALRWIPPEKDVDPVCGKSVGTDWAKSSVHDGSVYYFCSRECRELFEAAPEQYVGPDVDPGAEWTRPKLENHHA